MRRKKSSKNKVLYEIPLNSYTFDKAPIFEYDKNLDEFENIKRKNILIQYGQKLIDEKDYSQAILFHKYLCNNTYFYNDYYPYRPLTILYEKAEDYNTSIINIKKLLYSKIYLNNYQFTWFLEKVRQIIDKTFITEYEMQEWIDYYQSHGALYEKKLNKFLADRFVKKEDKIIIISEEEYDHCQEYHAFMESGRIYERIGNYDLAIKLYSNIISTADFNYYQFHQRLCTCFEKTKDYNNMLKSIRLYKHSNIINRNDISDEWFENKLKIANQKLYNNRTLDEF